MALVLKTSAVTAVEESRAELYVQGKNGDKQSDT
jgi:hypothetical protein